MKIVSANMNVLVKAVRKSAKIIIRDFGEIEKLQVSLKGPGDFVTASDKKVEKILIDELQKARPDYSILSEEIGEIKKDSSFRWIIDPIDGTLNFLNGIPHFAISIAYEEKGEIVCGLIFDPIKDEMFFAEKGSGAFFNNSRIRVTNKKRLKECILVTGGPKFNSPKKNEIFNEYIKISNLVEAPIRKFGSAALGMSYVAAGRFDGYWEWELKYWDIAAGIIILKEAGGFVDFIEPEPQSSLKRNVIASNSQIHQELLDSLIKKNIE